VGTTIKQLEQVKGTQYYDAPMNSQCNDIILNALKAKILKQWGIWKLTSAKAPYYGVLHARENKE
jgi:hypothetical protein